MQDAMKEDLWEEIGKKKTSSRKDTFRRYNFRETKVYSDRSDDRAISSFRIRI